MLWTSYSHCVVHWAWMDCRPPQVSATDHSCITVLLERPLDVVWSPVLPESISHWIQELVFDWHQYLKHDRANPSYSSTECTLLLWNRGSSSFISEIHCHMQEHLPQLEWWHYSPYSDCRYERCCYYCIYNPKVDNQHKAMFCLNKRKGHCTFGNPSASNLPKPYQKTLAQCWTTCFNLLYCNNLTLLYTPYA